MRFETAVALPHSQSTKSQSELSPFPAAWPIALAVHANEFRLAMPD